MTNGNVTDLEQVRLATLTPREMEACKCFSRGLTTQQVANELGVTWASAKTYRKKVRRKLGYLARF